MYTALYDTKLLSQFWAVISIFPYLFGSFEFVEVWCLLGDWSGWWGWCLVDWERCGHRPHLLQLHLRTSKVLLPFHGYSRLHISCIGLSPLSLNHRILIVFVIKHATGRCPYVVVWVQFWSLCIPLMVDKLFVLDKCKVTQIACTNISSLMCCLY